ncbi:uncharacterized protein LOC144649614 [Oculina patagonica]
MCYLHCIVIMLHIADAIKPASSARLNVLSSQGDVANFLKNQSPKERMTVPRIRGKSKEDSNSLSFAFTLPVQRKTLPLNSNGSKKQLSQPLATLTGFKSVNKNRQGNTFKTVPNEQRFGKEKRNNTMKYNNSQTLQMVGEPLTFTSQVDEGIKSNHGVNVSRESPHTRFGKFAGTPSGRPKIEWKAGPPAYPKYKGIPSKTQFNHKSGNIPLDEEIIVMGEPLIFTKGGQKVSDTLKHTAHDGNVSYGTQASNTSKGGLQNSSSEAQFHHPDVPVEATTQGERVQGVQATIAGQSSDHADFHNKTTTQNDAELQLPQGPQNNLNNTYDYIPENAYNQQPSQWPTQQTNLSQAERPEEVNENGTEGILEDGLQNNKSINSSSATFDEESMKQGAFGSPFQVSEQNQTEVIYENGQQPGGGHYLEDSTNVTNYQGNDTNEQYDNQGLEDSTNVTNYQGNDTNEQYDNQGLEDLTNVTNYQGNDTNEHYDNQGNKDENEDKFDDSQENPSYLPNSQDESAAPEEDQMDNSQSMNDDGSNLEQNQEVNDDEQPAGNQVTPVSNQRYMPVDEFGSPFYGNETDDYFQREALAAHNKYRAIHRAPPLVLSQQLSREAQHFANQLAKLGVARHEVNANLRREEEGDNVARGCSEWGGLTASGAVHRWYTQVCYMDWSKQTIQRNTKNFMQLIWKGTSHMGIGRAFGMRKGLPCTFIVARYRPGVINSYGLESNIDRGLFLPSYCNAEKDEGLMSTGFPSSFFLDSITEQRDKSPGRNHQPSSSLQNTAGPSNGIPYLRLRTWEKNIDAQDVRDLLKEQANSKTAYSFLPRINLAENKLDEGKNQDEVSMVVDDDDWKRSYKPPRQKSETQPDKHNKPK